MLRCGVAYIEKSLVLRYQMLNLVGRENPPTQQCPAGFFIAMDGMYASNAGAIAGACHGWHVCQQCRSNCWRLPWMACMPAMQDDCMDAGGRGRSSASGNCSCVALPPASMQSPALAAFAHPCAAQRRSSCRAIAGACHGWHDCQQGRTNAWMQEVRPHGCGRYDSKDGVGRTASRTAVENGVWNTRREAAQLPSSCRAIAALWCDRRIRANGGAIKHVI